MEVRVMARYVEYRRPNNNGEMVADRRGLEGP